MSTTRKTEIVTGGLSGIGYATARRVVADGTIVHVGARRGDDPAFKQKLLAAFVEAVVAVQRRVNVLVNAAGSMTRRR